MSKNKSQGTATPWSLFVLFFTIISATLVARHCYPEPRVLQQSQHQYWRKVNLKSTRGIIQDSRGNALVISETRPTFAVDPSLLTSEDVDALAQVLSPDITARIYASLNTGNKFLWVARKPSEEQWLPHFSGPWP